MGLAEMVRALISLLAVLGMLGGALWAVRRWDLKLPGAMGAIGARREARLALVERVALDTRRSLMLVRRDGVEHLLLIAPEGNIMLGEGAGEGTEPPLRVELARCRALGANGGRAR